MLSRWIVLLICEICFVFSKDVIDDKNCPLKNQYDNLDPEDSLLKSGPNLVNLLDLWQKYPLLIFNNVTNINKNCAKAHEDFLHQLNKNDLNALKMLDATGKVSSGVLRGNVNQYGDFDECLEVPNGKYCLSDIDLEPVWKQPLSKYKNLIHSHYVFKEDFNDPRHRVPGFRMIRWGFCIPRECSNTDLEQALIQNVGVNVRINKEMCQVPEKQTEERSVMGMITKYTFITLLSLIFLTTVLHKKFDKLHKKDGPTNNLLKIFSLQHNFAQLLKPNEKKIRAVDGVRGLCALGLLMSHKFMALLYSPYINRTPTTESIGMGWSVIGRTAILYTDGFILISGLLNANALLNSLEKTGNMQIKNKIINRIFRITPSLFAVILFSTYYLPSLGSGPLWPLVIDHHSELCKKYMWRNLFFVHNYYGFENMCLTHTHQVAIDMQLFLITPLVVLILWKNRKIGLYLIGAITAISTILRFYITYKESLSAFVYFGIPISRLFDTANLSYILPTHRATIYFMGVYLAYFLKYSNPQTQFPLWKKLGMWVLFLSAAFSVWLGPFHMARMGYEYDKLEAALFNSISPIFWGAAASWVIYATNRNIAGWFGAIFEWRHFERVAKVSYAIYLVQFPVFFYNIGKTRHITQYTPFFMFPVIEFSIIILISIILTVVVEMPFQSIGKLLLQEKGKPIVEKKEYKKIERDCSKLG